MYFVFKVLRVAYALFKTKHMADALSWSQADLRSSLLEQLNLEFPSVFLQKFLLLKH